jgi:hypothetical protein
MFAAIDGLLALCRNSAQAALAQVNILDGPVVVESELEHSDSLFIGDTDDEGNSATSEQEFGPYGRGARDEQITILCTAESWSGETDMRARRERVKEIVAAVENLVRQNVIAGESDPSLGGAVLWCRVTGQSLRQSQTGEGAKAIMPFVISARARL